MNAHWTTRYRDIAAANEEILSDKIRRAHLIIVGGWFALLVLLFYVEFQQPAPSALAYLTSASIATIGIAALYGAFVGLRYLVHRRLSAWERINTGIVVTFLIGITAYFLVKEGPGLNSLLSASVLLCIYVFHSLMHRSRIEWTATREGIYQRVSYLGHSQTHYTAWKEVKHHHVHPLTGTIELMLRGHAFHMKPRVHLIVPDPKRRKELHKLLAKILWQPKHRKHIHWHERLPA